MKSTEEVAMPSDVISGLELVSPGEGRGSEVLMKEVVADVRASASSSVSVLSKFISVWMDREGSNFQGSREVFGRTVVRQRSRYQWDDGSLMEIEISDLGPGAEDSIVKALVFDLYLD